MSTPLTLARPYARAAFELAASGRTLAEWSGKLAFAAQVAADPRVQGLFGDPRVGTAELASLFLPEGEAVDSAFAGFVRLLAGNHRLPALPEIAALFEQRKRDAERVLQVKLRSAVPIDGAETVRLVESLKRRFGREIELEQSIDPAILGGAIVDAGDVVIDGSVRGRLHRLETALTR
jgi:F-type H+-transporting ATPase subunit delta